MARHMRLFLIRHGETVDNVAQIYAGSRDSALTNHGYQQATRLGLHFSSRGLTLTHLFSSHLQRACKTAGLIREAQVTMAINGHKRGAPDVVQLPVLMEQDFGFYEGKKWYERPVNGKLSGKEQHRDTHKDYEGFVDIESKESLARRADTFLDGHLLPLLDNTTEPEHLVVAVVSHGIMLSTLWKRLLLRLPDRSLKMAPELGSPVPVSLEHLGAWSNTGYLEVHIVRELVRPTVPAASPSVTRPAILERKNTSSCHVDETSQPKEALTPTAGMAASPETSAVSPQRSASLSRVQKIGSDWSLTIHTINGRDHLKSLKRTGGGVGSSRHDASQKNIDSFFKRRKVD